MSGSRRIRWTWVIGAAFLSEVAVLTVFFVLLFAATLAGVPEIAKPMSPLDNVDALVSSFAVIFVFAVWVGRRVDAEPVLHGALIGVVAALLFTIMWIATTRSLAQPVWYVVAHALKVLGGISGGLVAQRRAQRLTATK